MRDLPEKSAQESTITNYTVFVTVLVHTVETYGSWPTR
jgi:hypothetical protein